MTAKMNMTILMLIASSTLFAQTKEAKETKTELSRETLGGKGGATTIL